MWRQWPPVRWPLSASLALYENSIPSHLSLLSVWGSLEIQLTDTSHAREFGLVSAAQLILLSQTRVKLGTTNVIRNQCGCPAQLLYSTNVAVLITDLTPSNPNATISSMDEDKSGLELAESAFTLVEPNPGGSEQLWDAYTAERLAVQESFNTVLLSGEEEHEYEEMWDRAIAKAISDTVHKLEEELGLPHDSLLSGTSILYEDSLFEEEDQPRTVRLLTRIYSIYSPSSVDLHLTYHSRSRMESIEWFIGIGYKINTRLSPNKLPKPSEMFRRIGLSNGSEFNFSMYNRNGWKTFYKAAFDDEMGFSGQRWKRYEVMEMGLTEDGLRDAHDALLGPHPCMENDPPQNPETENMKRKRLVQTARLLLVCVGISCSIGTKNSETDQMPGWRSLDWNLEGIPRWFAREVRKAAGFQLDRDAHEAKRHAQSVKDEMQGFY